MAKRISDETKDDEESVMSTVPIGERSKKGEEIVRKKLEALGFTCVKPEKQCEDMIAVKEKCKIPIQAKPLPLTRTQHQTCVDKSPLEEFVGLYVIWVERRDKNDAFLYIPDPIFRSIMYKRKPYTVGKIRPHKNRRFLRIPRRLKGFEKIAEDTIPDRYCKDKQRLIKELKKNLKL